VIMRLEKSYSMLKSRREMFKLMEKFKCHRSLRLIKVREAMLIRVSEVLLSRVKEDLCMRMNMTMRMRVRNIPNKMSTNKNKNQIEAGESEITRTKRPRITKTTKLLVRVHSMHQIMGEKDVVDEDEKV
jgi:hypothetical protein